MILLLNEFTNTTLTTPVYPVETLLRNLQVRAIGGDERLRLARSLDGVFAGQFLDEHQAEHQQAQ